MNNWSNLERRLLTAGGFGLTLLLVLFLAPDGAWLGLTAALTTAAAWEWARLFRRPARQAVLYAGATLATALGVAQFADHILPYLIATLFWLLLAPLWLFRRWRLPPPLLAAVVGWILLLPTFLAMLHLRDQGPFVLIAALAIAIVADTAAYFIGRAFGRHKLAPSISPGKTVEGALGASLTIALYAFALALWAPLPAGVGLWHALAAFMLLFLLSLVGDLFESWIKRQAGVKDSGGWLPGHGGLLDRIDSVIAVLPVAALLWMGLQ